MQRTAAYGFEMVFSLDDRAFHASYDYTWLRAEGKLRLHMAEGMMHCCLQHHNVGGSCCRHVHAAG